MDTQDTTPDDEQSQKKYDRRYKTYLWMRSREDYYEQDVIKLLQAATESFDAEAVYRRIEHKAIKHGGFLYPPVPGIKLNAKIISVIINVPLTTVMGALPILVNFGLIVPQQDGSIFVPIVEGMTGTETEMARIMRQRRNPTIPSGNYQGIKDKQIKALLSDSLQERNDGVTPVTKNEDLGVSRNTSYENVMKESESESESELKKDHDRMIDSDVFKKCIKDWKKTFPTNNDISWLKNHYSDSDLYNGMRHMMQMKQSVKSRIKNPAGYLAKILQDPELPYYETPDVEEYQQQQRDQSDLQKANDDLPVISESDADTMVRSGPGNPPRKTRKSVRSRYQPRIDNVISCSEDISDDRLAPAFERLKNLIEHEMASDQKTFEGNMDKVLTTIEQICEEKSDD